MAFTSKKNYTKAISRTNTTILERNGFIPKDSLVKKGVGLRKQINLYWKRRADEKKRGEYNG